MFDQFLLMSESSGFVLVFFFPSNSAVMNSLPKVPIFEFNEDTLKCLREQYDLDKSGRLEDSIKILIEWLKKQDHFVRKEYTKDYLERTIIISKGSVERAKLKLDKTCTFRTLLPKYFDVVDMYNSSLINNLLCAFLPKMTKDHYRIFFLRNVGQSFESGLMDFYKLAIMACEYIQAHEYCNGIIAVFDYTETNIFEILKAINLVDLRQAMSIIIEGYGMRLKGIHFVTPSRVIDRFISILKQVVSPKIGERIQVHKNMDTLYSYVPQELLPMDYGGKELILKKLSDKFKEVLNSNEFTDYHKEMKLACTNEAYRSEEKFNEQYMGMPGSFRKLTVD